MPSEKEMAKTAVETITDQAVMLQQYILEIATQREADSRRIGELLDDLGDCEKARKAASERVHELIEMTDSMSDKLAALEAERERHLDRIAELEQQVHAPLDQRLHRRAVGDFLHDQVTAIYQAIAVVAADEERHYLVNTMVEDAKEIALAARCLRRMGDRDTVESYESDIPF